MFRFKRRPPRELNVLVASRHLGVLDALARCSPAPQIREAFTTGGAYRALDGAHLAIVDPADLTATPELSADGLESVLSQLTIPWARGASFAADPLSYEARALAGSGLMDRLPPRAVALVNVSGGVGKTTCSLDVAHFAVARLGLPALVVELGFGASGLHALLDPALPHFYEVLTQAAQPGQWRGVTLLPMEYDVARLTLGDEARISALLAGLKARHVLTVFDVHPAHPFWPLARPLADEVLALTTTRPDALANALRLLTENGKPSRLVLNRVRGAADRLSLAGIERALDLPEIEHPERYGGELGRRLLGAIYPGWSGRANGRRRG